MKKYVPTVNCGIRAGYTVYAFEGNEPFDTEKECEEWITNNIENFTQDEMGGGVYPFEIEEEDEIKN